MDICERRLPRPKALPNWQRASTDYCSVTDLEWRLKACLVVLLHLDFPWITLASA